MFAYLTKNLDYMTKSLDYVTKSLDFREFMIKQASPRQKSSMEKEEFSKVTSSV